MARCRSGSLQRTREGGSRRTEKSAHTGAGQFDHQVGGRARCLAGIAVDEEDRGLDSGSDRAQIFLLCKRLPL